MGLTKHGDGAVIPDRETTKEASAFTAADREALAKENEDADGSDD